MTTLVAATTTVTATIVTATILAVATENAWTDLTTLVTLVGGACTESTSKSIFPSAPPARTTRLPRNAVERNPLIEPRRFCVLTADIEAHSYTLKISGWCSNGIACKSDKTTQQRMSRTNQKNCERTLTGKARMNAYKDKSRPHIASVREEKSWSGKRCMGMNLWNPGMRSRWRINMRSYLARMRDNTTATERETSSLVKKKDRRQHVKNNLTNEERQYDSS